MNSRRLLLPLVPLYRSALALRELRLRMGWEQTLRLRHPVISVGNLTTGGSGKTPFTIALARLLTGGGFYVDVLSRGYGRHSRQTARVLPNGSAEEFGDEPLLITREAGVPVYVGPQRYDAGLLAESDADLAVRDLQSPVVHLLDDGFQHRQLARDIDILLLDGVDFTEESLLPAGNLREPLDAIHRASVLAIPAEGAAALETSIRARIKWQGPVWRLQRRMDVPAVDGPIAAFCGIARPPQFFAGLQSAGLSLATQIAFPDHHTFTDRDVSRLLSGARAAGATALITTEKDLVRLGKFVAMIEREMSLKAAGLRITIENEQEALAWLQSRLARNSTDRAL